MQIERSQQFGGHGQGGGLRMRVAHTRVGAGYERDRRAGVPSLTQALKIEPFEGHLRIAGLRRQTVEQCPCIGDTGVEGLATPDQGHRQVPPAEEIVGELPQAISGPFELAGV